MNFLPVLASAATQPQPQRSPKQFSVPGLFQCHPATVFTRSQILDALRDLAYDGTGDMVDQRLAIAATPCQSAGAHRPPLTMLNSGRPDGLPQMK